MMKWACHLFVALAICASNAVHAQSAPPDRTDLRAAYCIRALQLGMGTVKAELSGERATEGLERGKERLKRLHSYLSPRLPRLDVTPIVRAMSQAERDMAELKGASEACSRQLRALDEQIECLKQIPAAKRINFCSDVSFLPN